MSESHRYATLDTMRGISILAVYGFHTGLAPWGFIGVDLFFAQSGFLITRQLLRGIPLKDFYIRRITRVIPLVWISASLAAALDRIEGCPTWAAFTLHTHWCPMEGPLTPVWSLGVEETFYVLAPFWCKFRWALAAAIAAFVVTTIGAITPEGNYPWLIVRMNTVILGMIGALWGRHVPSDLLKVAMAFSLPLAVGLAAENWGVACTLAGIGGISWTLLGVRGDLHYAHRLLSWLGVRCFSFYLFHCWFLAEMHWFFAFWATCLFSWASWRYFEAPLNDYVRRDGWRGSVSEA